MQSNLAQRVAIKSGRTVKSDSKGTSSGARGRWAESSNLTSSAIMEEDFPSLMGNKAPFNAQSGPSQKSINYADLKQKGPKQNTSQKKSAMGDQFPSLGTAASTLSNFRPAQSAPTYRNISGHQPAWQPSKGSSNISTVPERRTPSESKIDSSSRMITLSKKSGKNPAPMPAGVDDFPDLEPSLKTNSDDKNVAQFNGVTQKKKKNKSKKGQLVGEDLVSVSSSE